MRADRMLSVPRKGDGEDMKAAHGRWKSGLRIRRFRDLRAQAGTPTAKPCTPTAAAAYPDPPPAC
jgi:hypothetical protein